jgi:hypothetical protein
VTAAAFRPRFHDLYEPDRRPRKVGLCVTCRRGMWANLPAGPGRVAPSGDGKHCAACARHITHRGGDPRDQRGNAAETIPAERPEDNQGWRAPGLQLCKGLDPEPFEPQLFPEELAELTPAARNARRKRLHRQRRDAAATVCMACPVMEDCRDTALARGYEGLWGAVFFYRTRWVNLVTRETGLTVHAQEKDRKELEARRARAA